MTTGRTGLAWAFSLAVALTACGGGGGGGGGGVREYHVLSLHRDVSGDTVVSRSLRYTDVGGPALGSGEGYASDVAGLASQPDLPFAVDGSRTLTTTPAGSAALLGRMSEDGVFGAASTDGAGGAPELLLVVRRDPAPTPAALVGEWFQLTWIRRPGAGGSDSYCEFVEAQISLASVLIETDEPTYNDDGVVNGGPPSLSFPRSVSILPGGWVEVDSGAVGVPLRGGLSTDGHVLLLGAAGSGLVGIPGDAVIQVLVRRGLAIDTSDVVGAPRLAGLAASGAGFASLAGTGTLPGPTGGSISLVGNVDGTVLAPASRPLDATVLVSGKSSLTLGGLLLLGAAGPSGGFLATIGGLSDGNGPGMYVFVR
jgi:hypothetical protein